MLIIIREMRAPHLYLTASDIDANANSLKHFSQAFVTLWLCHLSEKIQSAAFDILWNLENGMPLSNRFNILCSKVEYLQLSC